MRNHPCQVLQTWINDQIIVSIFIAKHTTSRKFFPHKKNEKKVWIKKPELTMNKIVSQTKRNAFSKINTRSWYWFQCSFPSIARQGGQLDTQDKIVWPRSDDKHLKYASFCSDFYGWVIFSQNTNHYRWKIYFYWAMKMKMLMPIFTKKTQFFQMFPKPRNQDSKYSKNRVVLRARFTLYYTVRFSIETGISVNLNY